MLFSSWPFIAVFLPVVLLGYRFLYKKASREIGLLWLVAASLFFYGWFNALHVLIILASIAVNFGFGLAISRRIKQSRRKAILIAGVAANLLSLGYFKYTGLFFETLNAAGGHFTVPDILLPIGISFFTFQQIAWLSDTYRNESQERNFLHYALFVCFFPQLVAGPVVHHKEMIPQFLKKPSKKWMTRMLAMGITVFCIGLFKKVGIADQLGEVADPIYASAANQVPLTLVEAWLGAVSYSLQIYFDFSGYSDMAIGLAAMFGIRLPLNFFSPYKSGNITEFWRRWHITLSRFLRDYLYIVLGGNRCPPWRRAFNLMLTMLLGGLWHGASWTFVLWGGMHGLYLVIHRMWKKMTDWSMPRIPAVALTFLLVTMTWVFFRADSMPAARMVFEGMWGANGLSLQNPQSWLGDVFRFVGVDVKDVGLSRNLRINEKWYIFWLALAIIFFAPTTHEIMRGKLALDITEVAKSPYTAGKKMYGRLIWSPSWKWACAIGLIGGLTLIMMNKVNSFIYFQF